MGRSGAEVAAVKLTSADDLCAMALAAPGGDGTVPSQPGNVKLAIRVCQSATPVVWMYSLVYQNVQSSEGSMFIDE